MQGPNHVDGQINCLSAHLKYQSVDNEVSLAFLLIVGVSALAFAGGWIFLFCSIPLLENKLAFDADHGPPRNGADANGAKGMPSPYTNRAAMRRLVAVFQVVLPIVVRRKMKQCTFSLYLFDRCIKCGSAIDDPYAQFCGVCGSDAIQQYTRETGKYLRRAKKMYRPNIPHTNRLQELGNESG